MVEAEGELTGIYILLTTRDWFATARREASAAYAVYLPRCWLPLRRAACVDRDRRSPLAAGSRNRTRRPHPPPRAEFLLSSADSTFWVATTAGASRVRGAPLVLARYGGKFYEVYGADDDRSYDDALLVGERLYRRDLITGDSAVVFADTTVPRIAERVCARASRTNARSAPTKRARPTPPRRPPPSSTFSTCSVRTCPMSITSTSSLPGRAPWHATRRGVLDLRSGKPGGVADLFGAADRRSVIGTGSRMSYADRSRLDRSAAAPSMRPDERRAADALAQRQFDDRSFTLSDDGRPTGRHFQRARVGVRVPSGTPSSSSRSMDDSTGWWRSLATALPRTDDAGNDRVDGERAIVFSRGTTRAAKSLMFRSPTRRRREWPVAARLAPLHRVDWLDHPPSSDAERQRAHARVQRGGDVRPRDACRRPVARAPAVAHSNLQLRRQSCASSRPSAKASTNRPSS